MKKAILIVNMVGGAMLIASAMVLMDPEGLIYPLLGEALTNTVGFILIFMGTFMLAFNLVWLSEPKGAKAIKKHWRWH